MPESLPEKGSKEENVRGSGENGGGKAGDRGNDADHGGRGSGGGWVGHGHQGLAYTTTREGDSYHENHRAQEDSTHARSSPEDEPTKVQDTQRSRMLREKSLAPASLPPDFYHTTSSSSNNVWRTADEDSWGEFPNRGFGDNADPRAAAATTAAAATSRNEKDSKLAKGFATSSAWQAASVPLDGSAAAGGDAQSNGAGTANEYPLVNIPSPNENKRARSSHKANAPHTCASKTAPPLPGHCQGEVRDGSWFAARNYCEAVGARLCSASELERGLGWNTGCTSTASRPAWTSTPCGDGGGLERPSGGSGGGGSGHNRGRVGGFSGPGAAIGDGLGAYVLVNQGRLHAQRAAFDAVRRSQQNGAEVDTSGFGNAGGNAKLKWYEKVSSQRMSLKPPLSPSYTYTAMVDHDSKVHASLGHKGGVAATAGALRRQWSRRLGMANASNSAGQWQELYEYGNRVAWNETKDVHNNFPLDLQTHRFLESTSNNNDDSTDRLSDAIIHNGASSSFGAPIGGGLQGGGALALGTLARDAGGTSSTGSTGTRSKSTTRASSGVHYGEHGTVAAAARAVEAAATVAQEKAKATASAQAATIARQKQGRRSYYSNPLSAADGAYLASPATTAEGSDFASLDPGLGQLAAWEAGSFFQDGPLGDESLYTTTKPKAGSAAALAAAHSAVSNALKICASFVIFKIITRLSRAEIRLICSFPLIFHSFCSRIRTSNLKYCNFLYLLLLTPCKSCPSSIQPGFGCQAASPHPTRQRSRRSRQSLVALVLRHAHEAGCRSSVHRDAPVLASLRPGVWS